jgi:hypothetical protein
VADQLLAAPAPRLGLQRRLNRLLTENLLATILRDNKPQHDADRVRLVFMARFLSQSGWGAMSWLNCIGALFPERFVPPHFVLGLRTAWGLEVDEVLAPRCPGTNCSPPDVPLTALHTRSCNKLGLHTARHSNGVRHGVMPLLQRCGVGQVIKEDTAPFIPALASPPGVGALKMDLVVYPTRPQTGDAALDATNWLLDFTISEPCAASHLQLAASTAGHAASSAATAKLNKYLGTFVPATFTLLPLAGETYGWICGAFVRFMRAAITHRFGGPEAVRLDPTGFGKLLATERRQLAVAVTSAVAAQRLAHMRVCARPAAARGVQAASDAAGSVLGSGDANEAERDLLEAEAMALESAGAAAAAGRVSLAAAGAAETAAPAGGVGAGAASGRAGPVAVVTMATMAAAAPAVFRGGRSGSLFEGPPA